MVEYEFNFKWKRLRKVFGDAKGETFTRVAFACAMAKLSGLSWILILLLMNNLASIFSRQIVSTFWIRRILSLETVSRWSDSAASSSPTDCSRRIGRDESSCTLIWLTYFLFCGISISSLFYGHIITIFCIYRYIQGRKKGTLGQCAAPCKWMKN